MGNRKIFVLVFILAFALIIFHIYSKKQPEGKESERMFDLFNRPLQWHDKYPPDFEIELMNGEKFKLSDNIGKKIIILNFFATWCGPCREEMPELNNFYEKHREEPFIFIGIDAGENIEKVKEFASELEIKFPVGIDRDDKIQKLYTVRGFPTTVLIGADGKVHIYEVGPVMNADIAFDAVYNPSMDLIKTGKAIDKETYLRNFQSQQALPSDKVEKKEDDEYKLEGRAKAIAEKMYCPCGCSDILIECECKTAKDIKKKLKTEEFPGKTDEEIIKDLNKEFCVKGKKDNHDKG